MNRTLALATVLALVLSGCKKEAPTPMPTPTASSTPAPAATPAPPPAAAPAPAPAGQKWMEAAMAGKPLWATIQTTAGDITLELFSKDAPKTVANFVGLATGEKQWTDIRTGQAQQGRALYDGTIFHRVIPGFMIQGGDPLGTGTGDPGYRFEDEFQGGRVFDHPGILAMANAGPNTNGSQFFITVAPTPHLTNRHTIFGEVRSGMDVVQKIANAPRDARDRPLQTMGINRIVITDQPPK